MSRGLALALAWTSACAPQVVVVPGLEGLELVAALELDADGALVRGSEVRALGEGVELFGGETVVIVGWDEADIGGLTPTSAQITPRRGCSPRLPTPRLAAQLGADGPMGSLDPAALPALSVEWADGLCPEGALERRELAFSCAPTDCAHTLTPRGRCGFTIESACLASPLEGRVDPDGRWCGALGPQACAPEPPPPHAAARLACEGCAIDAYAPPAAPALDVRFGPITTLPRRGGLVELISDGRIPSGFNIGHAQDLAIFGGRAIVAHWTRPHDRQAVCGETELVPYDLTTLTPTGAPRVAEFCTTLIATSTLGLVSASIDPRGATVRIRDEALETTATIPLDATHEGEALSLDCDFVKDLWVRGSTAYVLLQVGTNPGCGRTGRSLVFRVALGSGRFTGPFEVSRESADRLLSLGDGLWMIESTQRRLVELDPITLERRLSREIDVEVALADTDLYDAVFDPRRGAPLALLSRKERGIRRGPSFAERAFVRTKASSPTGLWIDGDRAILFGTADANGGWASDAAVVDLEQFTVLPGLAPLGFGPPRRVLPHPSGGALALLGWDPALVWVRFADP